MSDLKAMMRLCIELTEEALAPIDALGRRYGWTREKAVAQMVDDWAQTFAWQDSIDQEQP